MVVSDNINEGIKLSELNVGEGNITLLVSNSTFNNNSNGGIVGHIFTNDDHSAIILAVVNANFTDNKAVDFSNAALSITMHSVDNSPYISISINHSNFVGNSNGAIYISTSSGKRIHLVHFHEVIVKECTSVGSSSGSGTVFYFSAKLNEKPV